MIFAGTWHSYKNSSSVQSHLDSSEENNGPSHTEDGTSCVFRSKGVVCFSFTKCRVVVPSFVDAGVHLPGDVSEPAGIAQKKGQHRSFFSRLFYVVHTSSAVLSVRFADEDMACSYF